MDEAGKGINQPEDMETERNLTPTLLLPHLGGVVCRSREQQVLCGVEFDAGDLLLVAGVHLDALQGFHHLKR